MEQHHSNTLIELLDILESLLSEEVLNELRNQKRHMLLDLDLSHFVGEQLTH